MVIRRIALLILLAALLLTACGPAAMAVPETNLSRIESSVPQTTGPAPRTLTVFAAASLTGSFQEIGKNFEAANPGVTVAFNFAGSQVLRTQLEQGASADVFASADHTNMDMLVTDNLVREGTYQDFVTNGLIVILPSDNPAGVLILQDLARPGLKLVLADPSVPAGTYALQILDNLSKDPAYGKDFSTRVLANVVSNETDVKQVVAKVELGEANAGIVYVTDAIAVPDLKTISIPDNVNVIARYPIVVLPHTANPDLATAFVAYVLSPAGQEVMMKWGFTPLTP